MNPLPNDEKVADSSCGGVAEPRLYFEAVCDEMASVLRQKTAMERLRIADRMWTGARSVMRGAIQTNHPSWTAEQVNCEIARRILGVEFTNATQ